jgi:hypothetical protein
MGQAVLQLPKMGISTDPRWESLGEIEVNGRVLLPIPALILNTPAVETDGQIFFKFFNFRQEKSRWTFVAVLAFLAVFF